jgi:sialic acid synthase SpsE
MTTAASRRVGIGQRFIGDGAPVFVIAEVGINHNGDIGLAEQLIREAKVAGADAVKLQTYVTEKRVPSDSPVFDILKQCELSFDQQRELFQLGADLGVMVFSTPFDEESVAFLNEIGAPCMKVASFDVVNTKLLGHIAATGKPVIISRGMADSNELDLALQTLDSTGSPYVVLHCISAYPIHALSDLHLSTVPALKERYACPVGFSDHWVGPDAAVMAVAAGAQAIEKHFTLDTTMDGPDHVMSADPRTLRTMIEEIRRVEEAMGAPVFGSIEAEVGTLAARRPT